MKATGIVRRIDDLGRPPNIGRLPKRLEKLQKNQKKLKKTIDKSEIMWYNNNVIKGWEHHPQIIKKRGNKK